MISRGFRANDLTGGSAQKLVSGVEALDGAGPLGARGRGGCCCGAFLGGKLAASLDDGAMKLGFGGVMLVLGARTLAKAG